MLMGGNAVEIRERVAATVKVDAPPDIPKMIERYLDGESTLVLGKECGVSKRTIYRWLLSGIGDERYGDLVTAALVARIADADEKLEAAKDKVEVAKCREMARFARMDLERRRPSLYGQKQEVKHTGQAPSFTVVLLEAPSGGRVIDAPELPAVGSTEGEDDGVRQERQRETAGLSGISA